jgi:glutamate synthase (ferredoxin)
MDSPLPVLSERPRLLYDYFQQNFAQVTNPPIDAIREKIVTSATVYVGNMANIMDPDEKGTAALSMDRPLLTNEEMAAVKHLAGIPASVRWCCPSSIPPREREKWRRPWTISSMKP